jgi:hypothetical protein
MMKSPTPIKPTHTLHRFDMKRLHATLDAERAARGLSWIELTAEINKPFAGTPSIPISVTTLRDMPAKSSVTGAVVLQMLRWLRRTPESFLDGRNAAPEANEMLPEPGGRAFSASTRGRSTRRWMPSGACAR